MFETETPPKPASASLFQRRVVHPIVRQLTQGITPEKIALTVAVGSACALFPILGTTTLLCFAVGISLRLNQPIIQLINGVCTPLHLPVILLLVKMGASIFHAPHNRMGIRMMNEMFWSDPALFFHRFGMAALHAVVAWAILAPFWIVLMYVVSLPVLRELVRLRCTAPVKAHAVEPPVHPIP